VLDRARDAPPARAAEAAGDAGDEAGGDPQAAPARVGERDHDVTDGRRRRIRRPVHRLGIAGLHLDGGQVEVRVHSGHAAGLGSPVGERDGYLFAAQVVGAGDYAAGRDDDAASAAPSPPEADDRRTDARGRILDGGGDLGE
jgi:hypothetical protein